ncbi:hypothetical protein SLEP1_g12709 [Rubroshorea leprosula]|uniref:Uncharacterized protein n=2 Tax=Rubroshorea leprosula TaxID=152421 RepID=A0AAV5IHV8_9ROSI|nr:hypothetical protein SLEP1_g12709 [Rubroshorea leprosula]
MDKETVPGGGATYIHLLEQIPIIKNSMEEFDEQIGAEIVANGCSPCTCKSNCNYKSNCISAGGDVAVVVEKTRTSNWRTGHNAMTGRYEGLINAGVIDPCRVSRCALQNSVSIAGIILTTQAMLADKTRTPESLHPHVPGITDVASSITL